MSMRALIVENDGVRLSECVRPVIQSDEVLVRVAYAGINHVDLLQTQGRYPLPSGKPAIAGMELSGHVEALGGEAGGFTLGQEVCGLVSEGAFADYAAVKAPQLLPVPHGMNLEQAAALPESCFTAWIGLFWQMRLKPGETLLVHGGTGAVASMAIQIAAALDIRVFTTAGSPEKRALCERLGAERAILYKREDFVAVVKRATGGKGVDAVLDMIGGDYFARNLDVLARGGRLAIIAFAKGARGEVNMAPVLLKQLQISGSTLRSRPDAEKGQVAREVQETVWPYLAAKRIKPLIDSVIALEEGARALARLERGLNIGKILLKT